ncbi:DUF4440 domain-containing protein [Rheinheimera sp. 1928-s]|uniref:DUF4440 domain-containing protein n=1 Tax=Rheinheimera sp. 1928-s TaxID=3033803 RepID=UPI00260682F8|nr:DUF4440 domain-containing protein [Rheinheimera sp. 1928-s]MDF3124592.1 DUF4440 domain-containing protein [Rheinheimera sp. 1928-s]
MLEQAVYRIGADVQSNRHFAEQLLVVLQNAINQRNWSLFSSCFSEDAIVVNLLGQRLTGQTQLMDYQQQLIDRHQDRLWIYQLLHLQQLDLDTFLINAEQHWLHRERQHKTGLSSTPLYVAKRQGQKWQICAGNML